MLLKGSDIKRTSRRTALLNSRNTRTIQLPLRHLKGIAIGMTPLSDWLNVLPRGSGIAGVTELPLPPKGISRNGPYIGGHLAFYFKLNFKQVYNVL